MSDFATAIKNWRRDLGWSQSRAATELRVGVRTLQGWEQGRGCTTDYAVTLALDVIRARHVPHTYDRLRAMVEPGLTGPAE